LMMNPSRDISDCLYNSSFGSTVSGRSALSVFKNVN
jgi:hypothetical protein